MSVRSLLLGSLAALVATLAGGCGSGGGSGSATSTASLRGAVVMVDGSTGDLGGIAVTDPRTGRTVTSAPDGSFDFGTVPAGTITLRFGPPSSALASTYDPHDTTHEAHEGGETHQEGEHHDDPALDDDTGDEHDVDPHDDGDDHDVGDADCDVHGVEHGEHVEVHVWVHEGEIERIEVSRSHGDDRTVAILLSRAQESDDPDVIGSLRLTAGAERDVLRVTAEHLGPGRELEWLMIDLHGNAESQGVRTADLHGRTVWESSTHEGDRLPFGAPSVTSLLDFSVEIRDAVTGDLLLLGTVPPVPTSAHDGEGHHGADDGHRAHGRLGLEPAAGVHGEAHVGLESRTGDEARERIEFEVSGSAVGQVMEIWVENPASGTLELVGSMTVGDQHTGHLVIDTHFGDLLPFGVDHVSSLVHARVEIRAADGTVLFGGHTPALVAGGD